MFLLVLCQLLSKINKSHYSSTSITGTGVQYFLFFIFLQSPKISFPLEYNSLFLVIYYYLTFFLIYAKISILKIKQFFLKGFIYVNEYFL